MFDWARNDDKNDLQRKYAERLESLREAQRAGLIPCYADILYQTPKRSSAGKGPCQELR